MSAEHQKTGSADSCMGSSEYTLSYRTLGTRWRVQGFTIDGADTPKSPNDYVGWEDPVVAGGML